MGFKLVNYIKSLIEIEVSILKICVDCGNEFYTSSRKAYYCNTCKNLREKLRREKEKNNIKSTNYNEVYKYDPERARRNNNLLIKITNLASKYTKQNGLPMDYGDLVFAIETNTIKFKDEDIPIAVELGLIKPHNLL